MGSIAQFYIKRSNRMLNRAYKQYDVQGIVRKVEKANEARIQSIRNSVKEILDHEEIMTRLILGLGKAVAEYGEVTDDEIISAVLSTVMTTASISEEDAKFYMSQKTLNQKESAELVAYIREVARELAKENDRHA